MSDQKQWCRKGQFQKDTALEGSGLGFRILFLSLYILIETSLVAQMVNAFAYNAKDLDLIPGLGRSPGEGNGNPLQYSCLENSMDRGAWQATVYGVVQSWTQLSNFTSLHILIKEADHLIFNILYHFIHSISSKIH